MTKRTRTDLDAVRRDLEASGAWTGYRTLLSVCNDKDATAQAKATAGVALVRAGGLFEVKKRPSDEDPAEMSIVELQQLLPALQADVARLEAESRERRAFLESAIVDDDEGSDVDVFG